MSNLANMQRIQQMGHVSSISSSRPPQPGIGQGKPVATVQQTLEDLAARSNTATVLGLDIIFSTQRSMPFRGLETLGIMGYLDPAKITGNLTKLPTPISLPGKKNSQSR